MISIKSGPCSGEYGTIVNLWNTAINHKEYCTQDCNVSLFELKNAVEIILHRVTDGDEIRSVVDMIKNWPS